MEIAMNILAYCLALSVLGIIGGVAWIAVTAKSIAMTGQRGYKRIQTPIDSGREIVNAAKGAFLVNSAHVKAIVADGRSAAQAVSQTASEIRLAGGELGAAVAGAKSEVDDLTGGNGIEALTFAKDAISLLLKMRGM